jgi:hypothetical protein
MASMTVKDAYKDAYVETVKRQLDSWGGETEHLGARADIILLQLEDKYYALLRALRTKEKEIKSNLQQIDAADEGEWQLLRSLLDQASNDMKAVLRAADRELTAPDAEPALR